VPRKSTSTDREGLSAIAAPQAEPDEAADHPGPLFDWLQERGAGVLLHPTSLPGDQGCGVMGAELVRFLDFLKAAGFKRWQVCPLGPTGYGDSPYQCFSAFAGNPYLVDLRPLVAAGFLADADLGPLRALSAERTDYGALYRFKWPLLFQAHANFLAARDPGRLRDFDEFKAAQTAWLPAYAAFRALKDHFGGKAWTQWPAEVRTYAAAKNSALLAGLARETDAHAFTQYLFFRQWAEIGAAARERGISIIGDVPIFVAADSADTWANPELFELNPKTGKPLAVAGVPPDYFSADGQLWGNPLYRWPAHAADGYAWWLRRMRAAFALYDIVRFDHFRGFESYWRVPAAATTARKGKWTPGPGLALFHAIRHEFPGAKLIAEDLGEITPAVRRLLAATGLPGMAVLQFAFGGDAKNAFLPHNHAANTVVYPGTHDNDTTLGWFRAADQRTRDHVCHYLRVDGHEIAWDLLRAAYSSPARLSVVPLQDLLSLGAEARFNLPSKAEGNWQWRYTAAQLDALERNAAAYLRHLAGLYDR
jgi:4-alpha-glucanotransferase